ncbi:MAG TPA: hypothetical protein VFI39_07300 [Gemmatimonadales bacterium]|nr:hypothetical protein [Gemmatimonadales bacterium]
MTRNGWKLFAATALLVGCSGPSGPDSATQASVKIVTKTSGANFDPDGYWIATTLNASRHVGVNDSTVYDSMQFGDHTFRLDSVATNCVVDSGAVHTWYLFVGNSNRFTFNVTCS